MYHVPVLLQDCIEGLGIRPEGIYADVTFGGGGHSKAILEKLSSGKLFGFDQDEDAKRNKPADSRFVLVQENFRHLKHGLEKHGVKELDGLLADLGVSSHQFDKPVRGFSFRFDAELDMRMDRRQMLKAADVVNAYPEKDLRRIFFEYGEVENTPRLVRAILEGRKEKKISTVSELKDVIAACVRKGKENQYYAKVFQALRIEVNDELNALKEMLAQAVAVLKKGGRIAVISYHSLEDRIAKNFFRSGNAEGKVHKDFYGNRIVPLKEITRKPVAPSIQEMEANSRARSARLRIAERI